MKIKKYNYDEFLKYTEKNELSFDDEKVVEGFHYFSANNIYAYQRNKQFILAIIDNEIVGVLKFADFNSYKNNEDRIGVCFVDVKQSNKKQGIAKKLIEQFFLLSEKRETTVSFESREGSECKIHNIFKKYADNRDIEFSM